MKKWLLRIGWAWVYVACALVLISNVWIWWYEGMAKVREIMSPRNVWNTAALILLFAPGVILIMYGDKKRFEDESSPENEDDESPKKHP